MKDKTPSAAEMVRRVTLILDLVGREVDHVVEKVVRSDKRRTNVLNYALLTLRATGKVLSHALLMVIDPDDLITDIRAQRRQRITKPPGLRFLAIVDFFYSPKTVERTFKPAIADWQSEYFEATNAGRKWKARWISVRYAYRMILLMGVSKVFAVIRSMRSVGK